MGSVTRDRREATAYEAGPGASERAVKGRQTELDGLRAMAVLCMVAYHGFFLAPVTWPWSYPWLLRFDVSVQVFFMLSGFLIYGPYTWAHLRGTRPPALGRYLLRRAARVYPAYWAAVGAMALLGWVHFADGAQVLQHLTLTQGYFPREGAHLVYTPGLGQAWTLVVEVSFYAFVPAWAWAMRRLAAAGRVEPFRQEVAGALMLFAAGVGAGTIVAARTLPIPFAVLPPHLTSLSWGMLLAVLATRLPGRAPALAPAPAAEPAWVTTAGDVAHVSISPELAEVVDTATDRPRPDVRERLRGSATELSWLAAWAVLALGCLRLDELSDDPGHLLVLQVVNVTAGALLVTPVMLGAPGRGWVQGLLTWRPLVFLGVVSFGIYLWHLDVLVDLPGTWAAAPSGAALTGMAVKVVVATAAGVASFYLLERPLMRAAAHLTDRFRRAEPTRPAPGLPGVPERHDVAVGVEQ